MVNAYLLCATVGAAFMVLSAILGWVGAGHVGHADGGGHGFDAGGHDAAAGHGHGVGDSGQDHGSANDLPLFSPMAIAGYITGFGGSGLIYQHLLGNRPYLHVPLATVTGGLLGVSVAFLTLKLVTRFESGRGARDSDAYGQDAEITVAIPPDGFGEVAYVAGGVRQAIPARGDGAFAAGQRVRIVRIVGGTAFVRALPELNDGSAISTRRLS